MEQDEGKMMEKQPLVSVIMPCYNGEKFIGEAIESVINQTCKNWELIVVDDGSTDNSKEIIRQYCIADKRIQYIQHKKNKGIPFARNTGIRASKGEYIALLDQDDKWLSNKLDLQLDKFYMSKPEIGLVFGNINIIDSYGCLIYKSKNIKINFAKINQRDLVRHLFLNCFIPSITVMFKRKCIKEVGGFDENILWGGDDYELWLRLANKFKFAYINKVLGIRRLHRNNYSATERMIRGQMQLIEEVVKKYHFLNKYKQKSIAQRLYQLGRYKQLIGNFAEAKKIYFKAFSTCVNVGWKPYIAFLFVLFKIKFNYKRIKYLK